MKRYFTGFLVFFLACIPVVSLGHVDLKIPVGGEVFQKGDTVIIQWEIRISHNTQNWDLYFSGNSGNSWETLKEDLPGSKLSYSWVVPDMKTDKARIRVVMDNAGTDYEDQSGDFTIRKYPVSTGAELRDRKQRLICYPDPFRNKIAIKLKLEKRSSVKLYLFDQSGDLVRSFIERTMIPGVHEMDWTPRGLPPGTYFLELNTSKGTLTRKLLYLGN